MKNRVTISLLGICALLLLGLLLRPWLAPAIAQAAGAPEVGRYSVAFNAGVEYFTDTKTGRVWANEPIFRDTKDGPGSVVGMHWVETGSPVSRVDSDKP